MKLMNKSTNTHLRKFALIFIIPVLAFSLPTIGVSGYAQVEDQELILRLNRDFGYSSGGGKIQGTFTMRVPDDDDLENVEFWIDDRMIAAVDSAPFQVKFHTGEYPIGIHTLYAVGITSEGNQINSNEFRVEFISQDEVWDSVGSIFAIILGVVLIGILFSAVIPALIDRHRHGKPPTGKQRYGFRGGTICPKCKRPFSIHIWGLNILVGKFDRCPHCGKWSVIRRIPLEDLRGAERAGQTSKVASVPPMQLSEQDKLRKDLEDSRYEDL
jgi:hypothetical protein